MKDNEKGNVHIFNFKTGMHYKVRPRSLKKTDKDETLLGKWKPPFKSKKRRSVGGKKRR